MEQGKETDFLLAQYKAVSDQILHWDTFFWSKSRFFLAVEGIALLGIGKWIVDRASGQVIPIPVPATAGFSWELFVMFGAATLLNLYLCLVWLRTGTRNREFLNMRFEVGQAMERHIKYRPGFCLYTYQQWKIDNAKLSGPRSHPLEIGIPLAFAVAWLGILGYLIAGRIPVRNMTASSLIWFAFGLLVVLLLKEVRQLIVKSPPEAAGASKLWEEFEQYCDRTDASAV